jgi:ferredoxin
MTGHSISLKDGRRIACAPDQTILEACLSADVAMPYNCRSGECAECRAVLLEGTVRESPGADPEVFTDADRAKARILTCLCAPTSDITIDIVLRDGEAGSRIERVNALVERVERVCETVVQVELETPWEIPYRAGQYFEWVLPGITPNRYFSAATAPGKTRMVFDVRLYPDGAVGNYVQSDLHAGQVVELVGPYGHFGFTENRHRGAICIAGGTGLAPIKAMIEQEIAAKSERPIMLLYDARRPADLYDLDLLTC